MNIHSYLFEGKPMLVAYKTNIYLMKCSNSWTCLSSWSSLTAMEKGFCGSVITFERKVCRNSQRSLIEVRAVSPMKPWKL